MLNLGTMYSDTDFTMSRLTQLGIFTGVLGAVILFLGLFPNAVGVARALGIGPAQIVAILSGLFLLVLGAYIIVYSIAHRGRPTNLMRDIGVRLGMTGLVFATASTIADILGFGSHTGQGGLVFGWLQALGMMVGFGIAAAGVLVYGAAARYEE